jgi:DNA invertase Pin-like site-specific DNA recombinase
MTPAPARVAIYARVSTGDGRQNVENQLNQLRQYAEARCWTISGEYSEEASTKSGNRTALNNMLEDANRGRFSILLVWAMDRLTRGGIAKTFQLIEYLAELGVEVYSVTEESLRTTGPAGEILLSIFAWVARMEQQRISERVNAGIAQARKNGTQLGRPWRIVDRDEVENLRRSGISYREIAKKTGVSRSTVERILKPKGNQR